ncbi:MAG: hypothetical protein DCF27_06425 [Lysobacteraceae bacterium]|nr:MAG: hypothetical protein DCF27_06425 [Xanthomonadaceae bacterium]
MRCRCRCWSSAWTRGSRPKNPRRHRNNNPNDRTGSGSVLPSEELNLTPFWFGPYAFLAAGFLAAAFFAGAFLAAGLAVAFLAATCLAVDFLAAGLAAAVLRLFTT